MRQEDWCKVITGNNLKLRNHMDISPVPSISIAHGLYVVVIMYLFKIILSHLHCSADQARRN